MDALGKVNLVCAGDQFRGEIIGLGETVNFEEISTDIVDFVLIVVWDFAPSIAGCDSVNLVESQSLIALILVTQPIKILDLII